MRRVILLFMLAQISLIHYGQIIADHSIIADFDKIPAYYISEVKKMMIAFPGESHSLVYRTGMELLEASYPTYVCNVATGEAPTSSYVRVNLGSLTGEASWFTWYAYPVGSRPPESTTIKNLITEYSTHGHPFHVLGFAWCSDMTFGENGSATADPVFGVHWYGASKGGPDDDKGWGLDVTDYSITGNAVNMTTYFDAMNEYNTYCNANSPTTKMIFTTGPVDPDGWYSSEYGYQGYIKHKAIRNYVKADPARILFDYADILCYDDNGSLTTQTWNGHTFPSITTTNRGDGGIGHIGSAGAIRLAKAQWWMLARTAGWDGITTGIRENKSPETLSVIVDNYSEEIRIHTTESYLSGQISLYNFQGFLVEKKRINNNNCIFNKSVIPSGIYFIRVTKSNLAETKKIIVLN